MKKLDFLLCGAQKAGTTTLHHLLRSTQGIWMPEKKELHYFDTELFDDDRDFENYHRNFEQNLKSQLIVGEATPIYIYWPNCLSRIKQYNPQIKLIASLRNPIERAYSAWRMEKNRGMENLSFLDAIRSEPKRLLGSPSIPSLAHRHFSYVDRGFYAKQLDVACALFSREQILLIDFQDLVNDASATCRKILDFLGLDESMPPHLPSKLNAAETPSTLMSVPEAAKNLLQDLYYDDIMDLHLKFGFNSRGWLSN